jgi:16S rRNA (adenine1518-N6/adenine1519-N6)-dimethyltransferase
VTSLTARIREALVELEISPARHRGQNYCINPTVLDAVVTAAALRSGEHVLEIGPGFGFLTERLLATGAHVTAVELEKKVAAWLARQYSGETRLQVVQDDVLAYLKHCRWEGEWSAVGMIPYNITSHLLRTLLEHPTPPRQIVFVLQAEVAERIIARPPEMSMLALSVQWFGHPQVVRRVSAGNFLPAPKVSSALLRVTLSKKSNVLSNKMFEIASIAFQQRRKKMVSVLARHYGVSTEAIIPCFLSAEIDVDARPEKLSVEQWERLTKSLENILLTR